MPRIAEMMNGAAMIASSGRFSSSVVGEKGRRQRECGEEMKSWNGTSQISMAGTIDSKPSPSRGSEMAAGGSRVVDSAEMHAEALT